MTRSRGRQSRGFTLLELILAMTITCMLGMTLYATLRTAFRAQTSATDSVEALRSAQIAFQLMGRDISSALPPTGILAGPFYGIPLGSGSDLSDTVEFYAITGGVSDDADPTRADGMRRIDLTLDNGPDGTRCLMRRVQRNLTAMEEFPPDQEILCRNVASFTCRYFDGMSWQDSWDSTAENDTLPLAVELTLELAPTGRNPRGYRLTRTFMLPCSVASNLTGGTG
jgi:general secretion pathway protein J